MNPRNLDAIVAELLGLDVLGDVPCLRFDNLYIIQRTPRDPETIQAVYLNECFCHLQIDGSIKYFGHIQSCLKVVSFYHKDDRLARHALEQICDKKELVPALYYEDKLWTISLWDHEDSKVSQASDKSLPLAICKALGELEAK